MSVLLTACGTGSSPVSTQLTMAQRNTNFEYTFGAIAIRWSTSEIKKTWEGGGHAICSDLVYRSKSVAYEADLFMTHVRDPCS
jgi:hypothetical protein